ncbi:MAG: sulfatase-like hydrolase/transferase [Chloroflexi bacterium]|nr:sulfatase-like hydrolase/transferase [Chloroflexota bacterium]
MTEPNILLIITDQQRTDTLGFMGRTPCQTPNIDRLAAEGVSFDHNMTTSPLCTPARASMFTGQYPHQVNMMRNNISLRAAPTLTNRLKTRGYHTAYAGKWHLDAQVPPYLPKGASRGNKREPDEPALPNWFDRHAGQETKEYSEWCKRNGLPDGWAFNDPAMRTQRTPSMSIPRTAVLDMEPNQTIDGWITDHAVRLFEERPRDRPFFLVCGYQGPHPPFKIPEPYYSMYDPQDIPEPPNFRPSTHKPRANTTSFYHQLWLDHGQEWEAWQKSIAVYWGFVTLIDDQIGRLLSVLEDEGMLDDTLIIFTSDHGEMLGQHGLWHKMVPYDEAIRVPLVMRYPRRIAAGVRSQAVTSVIDIAPTILSVIGEQIPEEMVGKDLAPAFEDGAEFQSDPFRFAEHKPLGEWHGAAEWRLVTNNRFKYVWNQGDLDELYDLLADPYETLNLIDRAHMQPIIAEYGSQLRSWMEKTSDPLLASYDTETGTASD